MTKSNLRWATSAFFLQILFLESLLPGVMSVNWWSGWQDKVGDEGEPDWPDPTVYGDEEQDLVGTDADGLAQVFRNGGRYGKLLTQVDQRSLLTMEVVGTVVCQINPTPLTLACACFVPFPFSFEISLCSCSSRVFSQFDSPTSAKFFTFFSPVIVMVQALTQRTIPKRAKVAIRATMMVVRGNSSFSSQVRPCCSFV
jgi:hypothetical protein